MRKTILSLSVAAAIAVPSLVMAQAAAPTPAPEPSPLTGNAGLFSQYIFRGLTQTAGHPAFQGGADYAHSSGLYAGTWLSNVSWLQDSGIAKESSLEWDFYGGYKNTFGKSDFGYDVGILQYYYGGQRAPGAVGANTLEAYGALSWKWISAKVSYSLLERTFGIQDSRGTLYYDLTVTYPVTDAVSIVAHGGWQNYSGTGGSCGVGIKNDVCASYKDYKLGASYALPQSWTVGGYFSGAHMDSVQRTFYTINGRELGRRTATAFIQKTF